MSQVALYAQSENFPTDTLYNYFQSNNRIAKQHFIEWWSGTILDTIWNYSDFTVGNSVRMSDQIDGGVEMETEAVDNLISALRKKVEAKLENRF